MNRLTLKHCMMIWALVGVGFLVPVSKKILDPDFWWHITTGKLIFASRAIPKHDPFSFTATGKEWIAHEWLSEVIYYTVYRSFGLGGIIIFRSLLIFLLALGLYLLIRRRMQPGVPSALVAAFLTMATCQFWTERPQLFSYLLLVSLLMLIDRWRRGASLWPATILFVLWINLHGAWIAGIGVLAIVLLDELITSVRTRKFGQLAHVAAVFAVSLAALFVNPIGPKLVLYPFQYFGTAIPKGYIDEWQRVNWREWESLFFFIALASIPVLTLLGRARLRMSEWILTIGPGLASLQSVRHVPVFAILSAPLIASQIGAIMERHSLSRKRDDRELPALNWVLLAGLAALLLSYLPKQTAQDGYIRPGKFPIRATDFLANRPVVGRGRLLVPYNWGGYAIYGLYPKYKVNIDGRTDVYGTETMRREERIELLKGNWRRDFESLAPDVVLFPRRHRLVKELDGFTEWNRVYEDNMSVVYVRRASGLPDKAAGSVQ